MYENMYIQDVRLKSPLQAYPIEKAVTRELMVLLFLMFPTPLQAYAIQRWEFRARAAQAWSFLGGIVHVRGAFVDEAIARSAYGMHIFETEFIANGVYVYVYACIYRSIYMRPCTQRHMCIKHIRQRM